MIEFKTRNQVINFCPTGGTLLELGVLNGDFTQTYIQEAIKRDITVYLVDAWTNGETTAEVYKDWDINYFNRAYDRVQFLFRNFPNIKIIKSNSIDFSYIIEDGFFDVAYFDCDHTFKGVFKELKHLLPKVKEGGYVGFHDFPPFGPEHSKHNNYEFGVHDAAYQYFNPEAFTLTGETEPYYKSAIVQNIKENRR